MNSFTGICDPIDLIVMLMTKYCVACQEIVAQGVRCDFTVNHRATSAAYIDLGCSLAGGHCTENTLDFDLLDSASPAVCDVILLEQHS